MSNRFPFRAGRTRGRRAAGAAFLAIAISVSSARSAAAAYSIQVAAFADANSANIQAETLRAAGWSPVTVAVGEGITPHKMRIGSFATYAEAWCVQRGLESSPTSGGMKGFLVSVPDAGFTPAELNRFPGVAPLVDLAGAEAADPLDAKRWYAVAGLDEVAGRGEASAVLAGRAAKADAEGESAKIKLARHLLREPAGRGQAAGLLADAGLSNDPATSRMASFVAAHGDLAAGDRAKAADSFRSLAADRTVPPSLRRVSARLAAGAYHADNRHAEAWAAFEALGVSSPKAAERAEARMEQAGLAYELAGRGKGTWGEVRALCEIVARDPESPRKVKATADLMWCETYLFEGSNDRAAASLAVFIKTYPEIRRETHTAGLFLGIALDRMDRPAEAVNAFEAVAQSAFGCPEKFAGTDPRARAAIWLAWIARRQGDDTACDRWRTVLATEFPGAAGFDLLEAHLASATR